MLSVAGAEVSALRRVAGGALEVRVFNPTATTAVVDVEEGAGDAEARLADPGAPLRGQLVDLRGRHSGQLRGVLRARAALHRHGKARRKMTDGVTARAVLVPVKSFRAAKHRLATVLDPAAREALARELAARVIAAAAPLGVLVVCDDDEVAAWALDHGARVAWTPGLGLSAAVMAGVAQLRCRGRRALPSWRTRTSPSPPAWRASASRTRSRSCPIAGATGPTWRSCLRTPGFVSPTGRAASSATAPRRRGSGLACQIVYDRRLAIDIDLPEDLALAHVAT